MAKKGCYVVCIGQQRNTSSPRSRREMESL